MAKFTIATPAGPSYGVAGGGYDLEKEGMGSLDAEILEIPAGTIKSRLRKARQQLEQLMATLASSPGLLQSSRLTLDAWAAKIRDQTGIEGGGKRR